jgi:hypothetical protein
VLAAIILVAMVIMSFMVYSDPEIVSYRNRLPDDIKTSYDEIVAERSRIYYTGYMVGFALSIAFIVFNARVLKKPIPATGMVCVAVVISTLFSYFYYILSPKTKFMISLLKTDEMREDWFKLYKSMQYYYHASYALGAVAVGVFAYAFRGYC